MNDENRLNAAVDAAFNLSTALSADSEVCVLFSPPPATGFHPLHSNHSASLWLELCTNIEFIQFGPSRATMYLIVITP